MLRVFPTSQNMQHVFIHPYPFIFKTIKFPLDPLLNKVDHFILKTVFFLLLALYI